MHIFEVQVTLQLTVCPSWRRAPCGTRNHIFISVRSDQPHRRYLYFDVVVGLA
jgi:hypothetical protein